MAATKSFEERKQDFLNRLKELYSDYELISDYVDHDTFWLNMMAFNILKILMVKRVLKFVRNMIE